MSRVVILKYQFVVGLTIPPPNIWSDLQDSNDSDARTFIADFMERRTQNESALKAGGLWSAMTSEEQSFIRILPSEATPQMIINASWLMESAECLLWALGIIDALPPYDTQAQFDHVNLLPSNSLRNLIETASLRPRGEIAHARDIAELWHWRSRSRQIQESEMEPQSQDKLRTWEIIRKTAEKASADGLFRAPLGNDFPAFGRPYHSITSEEWSQATSIARERHRALNWLCGFAPGNRWDETPTDT